MNWAGESSKDGPWPKPKIWWRDDSLPFYDNAATPCCQAPPFQCSQAIKIKKTRCWRCDKENKGKLGVFYSPKNKTGSFHIGQSAAPFQLFQVYRTLHFEPRNMYNSLPFLKTTIHISPLRVTMNWAHGPFLSLWSYIRVIAPMTSKVHVGDVLRYWYHFTSLTFYVHEEAMSAVWRYFEVNKDNNTEPSASSSLKTGC